MTPPAEERARPVRLAPVLALGILIVMAAAVLALAIDSVFWLAALVGATVIALALLVALTRATRLAMRPQKLKYDHSWWTNLFGGTSTPHPTRPSRHSGERH